MSYLCWERDRWKDTIVWNNKVENRKHNRHYDRGTDPSGVSYEKDCDHRYLEYDRRGSHRVVSHNNPYAEDFPTFANYSAFSIFGDQAVTFHDFKKALDYYNESVDQRGEEKYGPFDQHNYNLIGQTAYNSKYWDQAWKGYHDKNNYSIHM